MTAQIHNILFIFREYNDLDHMTPIMYQTLAAPDFNPTIVCMNETFDIKNDFRIQFLKNQFGISAKYIHQLYMPSLLHRMYSFFVCVLPNKTILHKLPILRDIIKKIKNRFQDMKIYDKEWFKQYCNISDLKLIVLDCVPERRYIYKSVASAKELNIPIFGTPHGLNVIDNDIWNNKAVEQGKQENEWKWIDHIAVASNRTRDQYINNGLHPDTLTTLGSARFCPEWSTIYDSLIGEPSPNPDNQLMVVYMDQSINYRIHINDVVNTLESISQIEDVDLVIKPHTRFKLSDDRMHNFGRIDYSHSNHLIKQAGIVITAFSSIGLEALKNNTILMYPSFFSDNIPIWAKYKTCVQVNSIEDTVNAIINIRDGSKQVPYSSSNIQALLETEIFGGTGTDSVLKAYMKHMREIIET